MPSDGNTNRNFSVKAKWEGIEVVVREESYTSKASALDFDPIPTYGKKGAGKVTFSGTEGAQRLVCDK